MLSLLPNVDIVKANPLPSLDHPKTRHLASPGRQVATLLILRAAEDEICVFRTPVGLYEEEKPEQGEEDHDEGATVMATVHANSWLFPRVSAVSSRAGVWCSVVTRHRRCLHPS